MSSNPKRLVVIVGRPNVGKSALFNRLAGRRIAIVHEESGVTRDRILCEAAWEGKRFELADTGGICNIDRAKDPGRIETGIVNQVEAALDDAAAVIFVVNVETGLAPLDEEVARRLRDRGGLSVVVAANKADNEARDAGADDFARLGFPVFPVSALHGRGVDAMMEKVLGFLPPAENPTVKAPLKVVIVGRPNVGKSLYINRMLRSDRVIVSPVPGTTRDSIDIPFTIGRGAQARHYLFVDTAGIRKTGKIDSVVEQYSRMRSEESIERADLVLLILDAVQGPTEQDKKIAAMVMESRRACILLVNKWDLAEGKVTQTQYGPAVLRTLPFMSHCPIVFVSAQTGYNIRRTVDAIDHVAAQLKVDLPTGILNRTLADAFERVGPPAIQGKFLKLYYATQVGHAPTRVALFVNDPGRVTPAYESYLVKQMRATFGLEGVPVILQFKARARAKG